MPSQRYFHPSDEASRVQAYKDAEEFAKASLVEAQKAAREGRYEDAREHLEDARLDGDVAETLRLESLDCRGIENSDVGHERAIDWIDENIFQKADHVESELDKREGRSRDQGGEHNGRAYDGAAYEGGEDSEDEDSEDDDSEDDYDEDDYYEEDGYYDDDGYYEEDDYY